MASRSQLLGHAARVAAIAAIVSTLDLQAGQTVALHTRLALQAIPCGQLRVANQDHPIGLAALARSSGALLASKAPHAAPGTIALVLRHPDDGASARAALVRAGIHANISAWEENNACGGQQFAASEQQLWWTIAFGLMACIVLLAQAGRRMPWRQRLAAALRAGAQALAASLVLTSVLVQANGWTATVDLDPRRPLLAGAVLLALALLLPLNRRTGGPPGTISASA